MPLKTIYQNPRGVTSFESPQNTGYGGYGAPDTGYGAPSSGYGAPSSGYSAPASGYNSRADLVSSFAYFYCGS